MISLKGKFIVCKVHKKTKSEGWKHIAEGDVIEIEAPVKGMGQRGNGGGGCYAQEITMMCVDKNIIVTKSFNQMANTINKFFELSEVES